MTKKSVIVRRAPQLKSAPVLLKVAHQQLGLLLKVMHQQLGLLGLLLEVTHRQLGLLGLLLEVMRQQLGLLLEVTRQQLGLLGLRLLLKVTCRPLGPLGLLHRRMREALHPTMVLAMVLQQLRTSLPQREPRQRRRIAPPKEWRRLYPKPLLTKTGQQLTQSAWPKVNSRP